MAAKYRQYTGIMGVLIRTLGVIIPVYALIFEVLKVPIRMGLYVHHETYNAVFLCFGLTMVFLLVPASRKGESKLPWYDILGIFASWIVTLYIAVRAPVIALGYSIWATPVEQVLGLMTFLLLCEAVRRTLGLVLVAMALLFVFHAKFAHFFPGLLGGPEYSWSRLGAFMYLYDTGMFGMILGLAGSIVIVFLVFGCLMTKGGAADFFMNLAVGLAGRFRGGPAKVAVIGSGLCGMISGSSVANVGVTGAISIPMMKKLGFRPPFAAAVESIASIGGMLMPPVMGIVAFLMADFTQISYAKICLAAIIPALLYFLVLLVQIDFEAAREGLRGIPSHEIPPLRKTLNEGWQFILTLVLLAVLLSMDMDILMTVFMTSLLLVAVSWVRKETRMALKDVLDAMYDGTISMLSVTPLCALAGIVIGSVSLTGLGVNLSAVLLDLSGGSLVFLALLTGVAIYLMGMTISSFTTYILLAIMVAPAMIEVGVPILASHMFIFYMGMSMFFTPPLCPTVFVAASIAKTRMFPSAFQSMRLGIVCYILPFVIIFNPALILMGSPFEIAFAVCSTFIGALFFAAALSGFLLARLAWWQRTFFAFAGIMFIFHARLDLTLLGLALCLAALGWNVYQKKSLKFESPKMSYS
ncbi:MAG: TRAP transporter fused permease subunit [Planctomycetota bacterium]|nr:MAG: TRAP transporter fused permease subunit [Planctomycetota bacterium]